MGRNVDNKLRKMSGNRDFCKFEALCEISDNPNGKLLSLFPQDRLVCMATRGLNGKTVGTHVVLISCVCITMLCF